HAQGRWRFRWQNVPLLCVYVPLLCVYDLKWYWQVKLDHGRGEQPQRVPRWINVNVRRSVETAKLP
ncbi:MAG: hypothetical protein ACKPKO_00540, partial [Candidatus Fonsibacter sp.]